MSKSNIDWKSRIVEESLKKRSAGTTFHEEPDDLYDGFEIIEDDEENYFTYQNFTKILKITRTMTMLLE